MGRAGLNKDKQALLLRDLSKPFMGRSLKVISISQQNPAAESLSQKNKKTKQQPNTMQRFSVCGNAGKWWYREKSVSLGDPEESEL